MPLTIARPSPAPRPSTPGQACARSRPPGHVEDPVHVLVGEPAAAVDDAELDPVRDRAASDLDDPSAGVCRIAFMIRLVITRDSSAGSAAPRARPRPAAEPDPPGPGDRVGAGERLADQVAERDRLGADRSARRRGSGRARTGRRPCGPSGPPRADLTVVARGVLGHAVLERLGHRADARPAASAGRGRPRRRARDGTPRVAPRAPGLAPAARWCGPAPRTAPAARRARGRRPTYEPCAPSVPRVLAQRLGPARRSPRRPASATTSATTPDTAGDQRTTSRSWVERNIAGRPPTTPASTAPTATTTISPSCHADRAAAAAARRRTQPDSADAGRAAPPATSTICDLVARSRGRLPAVADAPHRQQPLAAWSGRPRPSRAAGARGRSPWTGRRTTSPSTCCEQVVARERLPGCATQEARAGRTRAR